MNYYSTLKHFSTMTYTNSKYFILDSLESKYMGRKQNALQLGMTLYSHQKIDEQRNRKEKKKEIRKLALEN